MSGISGGDAVLPDQNGYPTFIVNAFNIVSGLNKNMVEIWNGGTGRVFIHSFTMQNEQTAVVTGVAAQFIVGRSILVATGTAAQTITPLDTTKVLPTGVIATAGGSASIPDVFKRFTISTDEWVPNVTDSESLTVPQMNTQNLLPEGVGSRPIVLNPNQGFCVTCTTNTVTGLHTFSAVFSAGI
jgi:hypothetical protein